MLASGWPATEIQLVEAGYRPPEKFTPDRCRACAEPIQFWTTPAGKRMPVAVSGGRLVPHWADCPEADSFRRAQVPPVPRIVQPEQAELDLFEGVG